MFRRLALIVSVAAMAAMAVPTVASAYTPYNYFVGAKYPGGYAEDGYNTLRLFSNLFTPGGVTWSVQIRYINNVYAPDVDYGTATSLSATGTHTSTSSYPGCYRNSTANGGGSGIQYNNTCRTTKP